MMNCFSCNGTGRDYNAADHSSSDCDVCDGTGHVRELKDVASSTLDERARIVAQRVIDEMCQVKTQRPRDLVERALISFVLDEWPRLASQSQSLLNGVVK